MDFGVGPRDKTAKYEVAYYKLSPSQESKNEQIQNQINAHFLTLRGSSTKNLCYQVKLSIKLFIGKSLKDSGKGWHACDQALQYLDAAPRQRPMSHGSLHRVFGGKSIPVIPQPPTRRISFPVNSFYSTGSNPT